MKRKVKLHLFVAYDLKYNNTQAEDYVNIRPDVLDILDSVLFISGSMLQAEMAALAAQGVASAQETTLLFDKGYAGKRNAVLYYALKSRVDSLIFLDDDEYPLAVTCTRDVPLWSGQDVFSTHLDNLKKADITNGHHCGYISPIPCVTFGKELSQADFKTFIEAISNDILEWEKLRGVMEDGGVTYADPKVLIEDSAAPVAEVCGAKFISGSNLGINLTRPGRVQPFFNPPGARGEDTFLSTCLAERQVLRVPCYTFHDGFGVYGDLLDGVLPLEMRRIDDRSEKTVTRFYHACVGWVRYKPLYLHITRPEEYNDRVAEVRTKLSAALPKVCAYFGTSRFTRVLTEFNLYAARVEQHNRLFRDTRLVWERAADWATQSIF